MKQLRTNEFCTTDRDPLVESLLARTVPEIAAEAGNSGIPELAGICLGGGYGRGEGGVYRDSGGAPHLYNDLDFFVFTAGASRRRRREIDLRLEPVAHRWTEALGVDVDFGPAKNVGALRRVARTLMYQELKHGHWQVWGEGDVLSRLPALGAEELPPLEGARLLLNRGMGLLLAAERPCDGAEDVNFILRNLNKAVLGSADALLIGAGRYRYRAEERLAAFEALAAERGMTPEWPERYARALAFKARPDSRAPEDWDAAWDAARRFWCGSVAGIAGLPADCPPEDVVHALHRKGGLHGGKGLGNCLNWVRKTRAPGGAVREWFDAPELRMLYRLYRLLAASGPARREIAGPEERRRLYGMWKSIN